MNTKELKGNAHKAGYPKAKYTRERERETETERERDTHTERDRDRQRETELTDNGGGWVTSIIKV